MNSTDIAIIGGGWAGYGLALQLRQALPQTSVVVVERSPGPVPETVHKIGESTVEVSSAYLREVLGLGQHLETQHLLKFGLRLFMSRDGNEDISRRLEFGPLGGSGEAAQAHFQNLTLPTYNLDRGRLENHLRALAETAGVTLMTGRAHDLQLSRQGHRLLVDGLPLRARWLVDASGRTGLLRRHLDTHRTVDHPLHAAWFRVEATLDVDDWSDAPRFRARTKAGLRRLSTNHLMGPGYWVWLIPLPSGATSVGLVLNPTGAAGAGPSSYAEARAWLADREPQLARALEGTAPLDFRAVRGGAFGCKKMFSVDRWAVTGDAGAFLDPLYSSGGDFIAYANSLITRLVASDLRGAPWGAEAHYAQVLFDALFQQYHAIYRGQYTVMGHPQAMVTKAIWDTLVYFGYTVPLFLGGGLFERDLLTTLSVTTSELVQLQSRMQPFFREWAKSAPAGGDRAVDQAKLDFLQQTYKAAAEPLDETALRRSVMRHVATMRRTAELIPRYAAGARPDEDCIVARGLDHVWGYA